MSWLDRQIDQLLHFQNSLVLLIIILPASVLTFPLTIEGIAALYCCFLRLLCAPSPPPKLFSVLPASPCSRSAVSWSHVKTTLLVAHARVASSQEKCSSSNNNNNKKPKQVQPSTTNPYPLLWCKKGGWKIYKREGATSAAPWKQHKLIRYDAIWLYDTISCC